MGTYYEVILAASKRPIYFEAAEKKHFRPGARVIVDSSRGCELGTISSMPPVQADRNPTSQDLPAAANKNYSGRILHQASPEEEIKAKRLQLKADEHLPMIKKAAADHGLPMKILADFITLDGSSIIIEYCAPGRVDFRALRQTLASRLKMHIIFYQVAPRDRTIMFGGHGLCGRTLCCASWLSDFPSISIKMAKDQNISLHPNKISGICGRLMCCLRFEQEEEQTENPMTANCHKRSGSQEEKTRNNGE